MKLKELFDINHDCDELFIRESNGSLDKPLFHYHLTSGKIPEELMEREVKHFQSCPLKRYERESSGLTVTLVM